MPLDIPGRETPRIQAQHLLVKTLQPTLALGDEPRRKTALAITRHLQGQRPRVRLYGLGTRAVAGIALRTAVADMRRIAQVGRQLGVQRPLDHPLGELLEQAVLAQDVFRVRRVFEQFIEQRVVFRLGTGHLILLMFGLLEDNQLHT